MSEKVAEIAGLFEQDNEAKWISHLWNRFNTQRDGKISEWLELRDYLFATDTTTTSNNSLGWKNKTTLPKLCQVRDNLHSNYLSHFFPNDRWLSWEAYSKDDSAKEKAQIMEAYMDNKTREGGFREVVSRLLYDYIDYGNVFVTDAYESNVKVLPSGDEIPGFIGPKSKRISPLDIVFNPLADSFQDSFKIVRSVKTLGEVKKLAMVEPDNFFWKEAIERREDLSTRLGQYSTEDFDKAVGYSADGFGNMYEYYMGEFMEILEFYGDYHNSVDGSLETNKIITIVDRSFTVRNEAMPNWMDHAPIYHVGWRARPDNLWAMGPLDNLVGMQYRIDHLENLKADAMDLVVHPPLLIVGEVEEFDWAPGVEIHADEGGGVSEVSKGLNSLILAENNIASLEDRMELMAGAPSEAMGIRTPGEKTAFEVGELSSKSGRIFQEKIISFEIMIEKNLNSMMASAARNLDTTDVIRVLDNDLGVKQFKSITREDITANGILRPVGARHFGKQAQDLQNLMGVMNSPLGQKISPHMSGLALTKFVDDVTGLTGYNIFRENVAIAEQQATQEFVNQAQEDLDVQANSPVGEE